MRSILWLLVPLGFGLVACRGGQQKYSYSTDAGRDSSIAFSQPDSQAGAITVPDTLLLRMDSTGVISWTQGRVPMKTLQQEVQDTLLGYYLHAGSLPNRLELELLGTVTMGIRGVAYDQISAAQEVVRNVIAVKEWGKGYARLNEEERKAMEQKHPILFQRSY